MRRGSAGVLAAVVTGLLMVPGAASASERSCGWSLEPSADRENILFPDLTTRYLGGVLVPPPGGSIEITGEFPHGRYMSFQTLGNTLQTIMSLRDENIRPDAGSTNPYLPGARRNAPKRNYTVHFVNGRIPKVPAPNTVYTASADGSRSGFGIAYRIYIPDRGAWPLGGVKAPKLTVVLPSGQKLPLPDCPDVVPDIGLTQTLAGLGWDVPIDGVGVLGYKQPVWHKYVNFPTTYGLALTDNDLTGPALSDPVTQLASYLPSGLGESFDNKYVYTFLSHAHGHVAVIRGKLPTTPRTYDKQKAFGTGQMRYWSMCTGIRTTQTFSCVTDEDMKIDRRRRYEVVVSTAAGRPTNATTACGVEWLAWGPDPQGDVVMRNMLPRDDFKYSVQKAAVGREAATMGAYLPSVTYYKNATAYEREGCRKTRR